MLNTEFMRLSDEFKSKALHWANSFEYCCILDSNAYADPYGQYDLLIAAGARNIIETGTDLAFEALQNAISVQPDWYFGIFGYDLKNGIEALSSANTDPLEFPDLCFFNPEYLIISEAGVLRVEIGDPSILQHITEYMQPDGCASEPSTVKLQPAIPKECYLEKVSNLQHYIARGDVYEVTFCQAFHAENASIDPASTYQRLNAKSPTPFSAYLKLQEKYLLCASPERFLRKKGEKLISQPIKGTAKRHADPVADQLAKTGLAEDLKEQTENVMIVDLVRNDLTRSAVPATVQVEEKFGIYSFAQVHQMISTISCKLDPNINLIEAIKNSFPMGSMTGAPKIRAMELIDMQEENRRGAFSGAVGYISPDGDFDLNVVIRSLLYAKDKRHLSFQVGSAITAASDPEKEYEECMLKASAIIETVKGPH